MKTPKEIAKETIKWAEENPETHDQGSWNSCLGGMSLRIAGMPLVGRECCVEYHHTHDDQVPPEVAAATAELCQESGDCDNDVLCAMHLFMVVMQLGYDEASSIVNQFVESLSIYVMRSVFGV